MASFEPVTLQVGIEFEKFEWKVLPARFSAAELEESLNRYSREGWDVFSVTPPFVIFRRNLPSEDAT